MGVLGTLSGQCVRVQEAAHPAIRSLEPGFPCEQHTYAHAVIPLVCKSLCAEVPTAALHRVAPNWENNTTRPLRAQWAHYTMTRP